MTKKYSGFQFLPREALFKRGFHPAFGEHVAIDAAGTAWLVLLDDYFMNSERIARIWTRRHTPNMKYWPDFTGRRWCDTVNRFLVVSTDDLHAERHRKWIKKSIFPAEVMYMSALWKT